jgi:hypothetical protein
MDSRTNGLSRVRELKTDIESSIWSSPALRNKIQTAQRTQHFNCTSTCWILALWQIRLWTGCQYAVGNCALQSPLSAVHAPPSLHPHVPGTSLDCSRRACQSSYARRGLPSAFEAPELDLLECQVIIARAYNIRRPPSNGSIVSECSTQPTRFDECWLPCQSFVHDFSKRPNARLAVPRSWLSRHLLDSFEYPKTSYKTPT